jgi:hypothetical protein
VNDLGIEVTMQVERAAQVIHVELTITEKERYSLTASV